MTRADTVKIDTDEGRITLVVTTEDGDRHTFDIHHLALEVEAEVRRELRPYALEAEHARAAIASRISRRQYINALPDEDGYAPDDPKHPTYHERMAEASDNAERYFGVK